MLILNISKHTNAGSSPLHEASEHSGPKMVQYLIDNKADPKLLNENGQSTCYMAARGGNQETLELLIKNGKYTLTL